MTDTRAAGRALTLDELTETTAQMPDTTQLWVDTGDGHMFPATAVAATSTDITITANIDIELYSGPLTACAALIRDLANSRTSYAKPARALVKEWGL